MLAQKYKQALVRYCSLILLLSVNGAHAVSSSDVDEPASIQTFDGIALSGKWRIPENAKWAVVILQGSGNVGSDGDVSGPLLGDSYQGATAKLSDQLAAQLAKSGVVSLRFAKRGFDQSDQLGNQTIPFLVRDVQAALSLVKSRFPKLNHGIVGFSEGALVASLVAAETNLDALFLIGLPSRAIDDMISYQFIDWPVALVRRKLDLNQDGYLSELEIEGNKKVPLLGPGFAAGTAAGFDVNHDGKVSIVEELIPEYQKLHKILLSLLQTPSFSGWYESLRQLRPFSEYAKKISAPVFLYQAMDDAQIRWSDVAADQRYFSGPSELRLFSDVGHCFAPMGGSYGEVKTSGPFSEDLLLAISKDVARLNAVRH